MKKIIVNYPGDNLFTFNLDDAPSHDHLLAKIFASCNNGSGQECKEFKASKTRSLSVNDLVKIDDQWYQCASFGWKAVSEEFVDELEKAVVEHPKFSLYGAWSALDDVMWSKRKK